MVEDQPTGILTIARRLTGLAAIYVLGDVFIKGLNYLLLPLYSRFLAPDEYGIIAITEMLRIFLVMMLSLGMIGVVLRFVHVFQAEEERRSFFGTLWLFLVFFPGLITYGLLVVGDRLTPLLFPSVPFNPYIRNTLLATYFYTAFTLLPLTLYRARDEARAYVSFGILNALGTTVAIIIHVVVLQEGAGGWIRGQLEAAIGVAVISTLILTREVKPSLKWHLLKPALQFSLPLVPHFFSHWVLSVSDRIILERYVGLNQLGLYTLGYQFGLAYQVVVTGVNNAMIPMFGRASANKADRQHLPRTLTYYLLTIALLALIFALLGPELIALVFPQDYRGAAPYIAWVVFGYLAYGIYFVPTSYLVITTGESKPIPLATLTAASMNVALNLWLIPRYGAIAAAINTAVSYMILAAMMTLITTRISPLPVEYKSAGKILASTAILFIAGRFLMHLHPIYNVIIGLGLVVGLPLVLHVLRFWKDEELQRMAQICQRYRAILASKRM